MTIESEDLRLSVSALNLTVGDLRVAVAELKTTLTGYIQRDKEDRKAAADLLERVTNLEKWRSRIQGQIALAFFLIGVLTTVGGASLFHIHP